MIRVSFKTHNGHYLIADDSRNGYRIHATPNGVGPWEIFTIIPLDGRNDDSLRSGDRIQLQTHHGRYVTARNGGGGRISGEPPVADVNETFTIEKTEGSGDIGPGNPVTLRTGNGRNFLMAIDGGGNVVNAGSTNRREWERFSVEFWNPIPIRLRTHDFHFLVAENGGGREITATRLTSGEIWETFTLANRSRRSGLVDGDKVCLQVWDGRFVSAVGGGGGNLLANQNRAGQFETFTIQKVGNGEISLHDQVWLQTHNGTNYVMAVNGGGGIVNASSTQGSVWEKFQLESAAAIPISFSNAPSLSPRELPGHPLHSPRPRRTTTRKAICFVIGFLDRHVDDSITAEVLRRFFFNVTDSVQAWFRKCSSNAINLQNGGTFTGLTVPWNYVTRTPQEYFSGLLSTTERERPPFRFRDLDTDHDGVITGEQLIFVVLDCTGLVNLGSKEPLNFTYDGVRYSGQKFTAGLNVLGVGDQGIRQLENIKGTLVHELSHILLDLPDRYYGPLPPRGDVIATSSNRAEWETFAFISRDSDIRPGARVRLQVLDGGDYLVADTTEKRYLNRRGSATDRLGEFILGAGPIADGQPITLRLAATNRYVTARLGGGDVVQAIAETAMGWETFTIERSRGSGPINSGDPITLKTSNLNPYGQAFYLMAQPDGRKNDPNIVRQGWWQSWEGSLSGNGVGGDFDIMDNDKSGAKLHAAYDRIKFGWLEPKVLTPDNKACYALWPSIDLSEVFILWDPLFPDEWYIIENRQHRPRLDEIPSNGLIISWVNEKASYWNRWHELTGIGKFPAVISAAAPTAPPNSFVNVVQLRNEFYRRRDRNTAFRSGTVILPRGDGSPSRFRLSFRALSSERMSFCIL